MNDKIPTYAKINVWQRTRRKIRKLAYLLEMPIVELLDWLAQEELDRQEGRVGESEGRGKQ